MGVFYKICVNHKKRDRKERNELQVGSGIMQFRARASVSPQMWLPPEYLSTKYTGIGLFNLFLYSIMIIDSKDSEQIEATIRMQEHTEVTQSRPAEREYEILKTQ